MNTLNCESKKNTKRTITACVVTTIITICLTITVLLAILFSIPGFSSIFRLNWLVNQYHLNNPDKNSIEEGILNGYISGLDDKYAFYFNSEDTQDRTDHLLGVDKGLGIIVTKHPESESIRIIRVYDNSPAAAAGIKVGDIITAIDGVDVSTTGYLNAVNSISRDIGESVSLSILRGDTKLDISALVSEITVQTVFYKQISDYGYIEITSFNEETVDQFKTAVTALTESGVKGLIFDLRGNGGGTVSSVGKILDVLVPEGDVMIVRYRNGDEHVMLSSDGDHIDLPMAVLTDGNTASASELFAATIRDFDKGVLIGEKTYGKGVMQNTYRLFGGSSVVFTVAEFLPHSKNSFNSLGLSPDYEVILSDEEKANRYFIDPKKDKVVNQAIEWLNGDK